MPEICQKYARNIWQSSKEYAVDFAVYHEYTFVYLAESNVFQLYVKRMLKFTQPSNSLVGISRSEVFFSSWPLAIWPLVSHWPFGH